MVSARCNWHSPESVERANRWRRCGTITPVCPLIPARVWKWRRNLTWREMNSCTVGKSYHWEIVPLRYSSPRSRLVQCAHIPWVEYRRGLQRFQKVSVRSSERLLLKAWVSSKRLANPLRGLSQGEGKMSSGFVEESNPNSWTTPASRINRIVVRHSIIFTLHIR